MPPPPSGQRLNPLRRNPGLRVAGRAGASGARGTKLWGLTPRGAPGASCLCPCGPARSWPWVSADLNDPALLPPQVQACRGTCPCPSTCQHGTGPSTRVQTSGATEPWAGPGTILMACLVLTKGQAACEEETAEQH